MIDSRVISFAITLHITFYLGLKIFTKLGHIQQIYLVAIQYPVYFILYWPK